MKFVLFALLLTACGSPWYEAWKSQREATDALRPSTESAPEAAPEPAIRLRVLILVADDYRAGVLDWRSQIANQLERVNSILTLGLPHTPAQDDYMYPS